MAITSRQHGKYNLEMSIVGDGTPWISGYRGDNKIFHYEVWFPVEKQPPEYYLLPLEIIDELVSAGNITFVYDPNTGLYCFVSFASRFPFHRFRHLTPIR